jgi:hypothetical protein
MQNKHTNKTIRRPEAVCEGDHCGGDEVRNSPVAGLDVLMANEEGCPGAVDFWLARIKQSLRGN